MIAAHKLLQCPICRANVNESLECSKCGERYAFINDVYIFVNQKLSNKEWKWDQSVLSDDKMRKKLEEYRNYLNEGTKTAQDIWWLEMNKHIGNFQGVVGDVASGLGGMLEKLLNCQTGFFPIATDIDPNVLAWTTKKMKERYKREFISVATNAKSFAFKDNAFDYLTSAAGLNNIPNITAVLAELYRVLKSNGKLVVMHSFIEEESNSHKRAKEFNCQRAFVEKFFIGDLKQAGFKKVKTNIVSSAVWAENPMDALPVAGDLQYYAIVEAEK
jgi:ubiquinone/menaquinone biosynthesis C-methylase UbiE